MKAAPDSATPRAGIWGMGGSLDEAAPFGRGRKMFAHLALADQGGPAHPGFAKLAPTDATTLVCAPCAN
jgi:hypothetical protein